MSGAVLEFRLLGPVEVWRAGARVPVRGLRQERALLALLFDAGRVVSLDRLIEALWDEEPPASARRQVQDVVAQLRRLLSGPGGPPAVITTEPSGYRLDLAAHHLDAASFTSLVTSAGDPSCPRSQALGLLRDALARWRTPALSGSCGPALEPAARAWDERRLAALEDCLRLEAEQGGATEAIRELYSAVAAHPLREPLVVLLMTVLAEQGRRAEAVEVYHALRGRLADDLGIDPGPAARRTYEAVLRDGAERPPGSTPAAPPPPATAAARPAQLPAEPTAFTGRSPELAALDELLASGGRRVVVALTGEAGVGKTALALRWAHRVRGRFGDGQLFLDLRGYDRQRPLTVAEALAALLVGLGVPSTKVPAEPPARSALLRTLTDGRRLLMVLDNAASAEQVRPLLPGGGRCVVLVTSRDRLAGLVARDGVERIPVTTMTAAEAYALLRSLTGTPPEAERTAVEDLVDLCARLPLALRVAAEHLVSRPGLGAASLASRLRDERGRLAVLDAGGDESTAVRSVLSWSYRHLDPPAAQAFRALAVTPPPHVSAEAVAAMTGTAAVGPLDDLCRAHLAQRVGGDRYTMHDLLRAYGGELAEDAGERAGAVSRLLDHYLQVGGAAVETLYPRTDRVRGGADRPAAEAPADPAAWLAAEHAALVSAVGLARRERPDAAVRMAGMLRQYLDASGQHPDAASVHTDALHAARQLGDRSAEGAALTSLGVVHLRWGQLDVAVDHLDGGLAACRAAGDRHGAIRASLNLGLVYEQWGRAEDAATQYTLVLEAAREVGSRAFVAIAERNLGDIRVVQDRHDEAIRHYRAAAAITAELGDAFGEALAWHNLGHLELRRGRLTSAEESLLRAGSVFRRLGHRTAAAHTLDSLGEVYERRGRHDQAADHFRRAATAFAEIGDADGEIIAETHLAEACVAAGRLDEGIRRFRRVRDLAAKAAADRLVPAIANGLGEALTRRGEHAEARSLHRQALEYAERSADRTEIARARSALEA